MENLIEISDVEGNSMILNLDTVTHIVSYQAMYESSELDVSKVYFNRTEDDTNPITVNIPFKDLKLIIGIKSELKSLQKFV